MAAAISLSLSPGLHVWIGTGTGTAQAQPGQAPAQVKKLDDNKEVLRPIPTVSKAKSDKTTAPTDKTSVGKDGDKKLTTAFKRTAAPDKKTTTRTKTAASGIGSRFVPPPPPTTPTMLGDGSDFGFYSGMPIEMLSREGLKDKAKEISIQYKDACRELEDHSKQKEEKIERAKEFEGLFNEGVVSRRELEASQKEAAEVNSDIDRLSFKVKELKGLLDRVNKRMSQTAAKKSGHKLIN